jgi:hypothetical protein
MSELVLFVGPQSRVLGQEIDQIRRVEWYERFSTLDVAIADRFLG